MLIAITLLFLGFDSPVLAAVSNAVTFKNPNEPLHGHLALTGNPTEMRYDPCVHNLVCYLHTRAL